MRRAVLVSIAVLLLGGTTAAQAETPYDTVTGELVRVAVDRIDGVEVELTAVVPETGPAVRVVESALEDVESGATVTVTIESPTAENQDAVAPSSGVAVLDVTEVASAESDIPLAYLAEAATPARSVAVLTSFLPGQTADSVTPMDLAAQLASEVSPYWSDSTGGVVSFTPGTTKVAGAYTDWGSSATCTTSQVLGFLQWSSEQVGVWPTVGTGRHSVAYTPEAAACGFAGVAHVGYGGSVWINGVAPSSGDYSTSAHELGHTLGLHHSNTRVQCAGQFDGAADACIDYEYGDAYDVMGVALGGPGPLSGAQLDALGLLDDTSAVGIDGPTTVTLAPVGGLSGTRFAVFAVGDATYYVEYRAAVGRDEDLATSRRGCPTGLDPCSGQRTVPGVVIHRVDGTGEDGTSLVQVAAGPSFALGAGGTFTTAGGSYTVEVDRLSASSAVIMVNGGTPVDATYTPVAPVRILPRTTVKAGHTVTVTVPNVPANATAVAVNITSTSVSKTSYVSACATGTALSVCRRTSALNPSPGADTPSAAIVALGGSAHNKITVYNNAGTLDLLVDLAGYYVADDPEGGLFVPRTPSRALDKTVRARSLTTVRLPKVPTGATAAILTVTASAPTTTSYVSACPGGQAVSTCRTTSVLNPTRGRDVANLVVVKLGGTNGDSVQLYNNAGSVRLIADVSGFFVDAAQAPAGSGAFRAITPTRVMSGVSMSARSSTTRTLTGAPDGAVAVAMNLTAAATTGTSYISACPGGTALAVCRTTSVLNPAPRVDTSDNALVKLGGSKSNQVLLYNNAARLALYADVLGYFVVPE